MNEKQNFNNDAIQFTSALSTPSFEYSGYKKINTKWNKKQTENTGKYKLIKLHIIYSLWNEMI